MRRCTYANRKKSLLDVIKLCGIDLSHTSTYSKYINTTRISAELSAPFYLLCAYTYCHVKHIQTNSHQYQPSHFSCYYRPPTQPPYSPLSRHRTTYSLLGIRIYWSSSRVVEHHPYPPAPIRRCPHRCQVPTLRGTCEVTTYQCKSSATHNRKPGIGVLG